MAPDDNNLLITGGAGFLGRHLARAYAERGRRVTVLDDLSCTNSHFGCPELDHPCIRCVRGSTLDGALLDGLLRTHGRVIHFASVVGVGTTIDAPLETALNLTGTIQLAQRLTPAHTVLFGSSADVYGMHSRVYPSPMREDDDVLYEHALVNRWVYPRVKAVEENVIAASPARGVIVRIFNCIGPGMDYPHAKRVVPQFMDAVLRRRPLRLSGDGGQVRCFCHYRDTLAGIGQALEWAAAQAPGAACAVNIGNDEPVTIRDLAHTVNRLAVEMGILDAPLPIVPDPGELYSQPFEDGWNRIPDLRRARDLFGYAPTVGLEAMLRETLEWCRGR